MPLILPLHGKIPLEEVNKVGTRLRRGRNSRYIDEGVGRVSHNVTEVNAGTPSLLPESKQEQVLTGDPLGL